MSAGRKTRHHSKWNPCPVCQGGDNDPRGQGKRCTGYDDDGWVMCSREELAGTLTPNLGGLYAHRATGLCKCGIEHAPDRELTEWDIRDAEGRTVATHVRKDRPDGTKTYWWTRSGSTGLGGLPEASLPLYGSERASDWPHGCVVLLVEGEKDADALLKRGFQVVANVLGAPKAHGPQPYAILKDHPVIAWPDNDSVGREQMRRSGRHLVGVAPEMKVFEWSDAKPKEGAADYFSQGGTADTLRTELASAIPFAEWCKTLQGESSPKADRPGPDAAVAPYKLTRLSTVTPRPLEWLWRYYIPRRMVTFIAGDGARLKSTITLDIAARITRGLMMPDGTPGLAEPADVIVLSTEDDLASVIVPRLTLAGADLQRVSTIKLKTADGDERDPLVTPGDLATLAQAIQEASAALVIFDPLAGFTDGATTDLHRNDDTRRMMAALHRLAELTGVAILAVHHFSRAARVEASHRLTGSLALVNAARSVLVVGPDPGDHTGESMVLALSDKTNVAPRSTPSLSYRADVPEGAEHPRIAWCGPSTVTSRDLASAATDPGERGAVDEAMDFLRQRLAHGPVKGGDLLKDARAAGISERTLERARQRLGTRSRREGGAAEDGWWIVELPASTNASVPASEHSGGGVSQNSVSQAHVPNAANGSSDGPIQSESVPADHDRRRREAEILSRLLGDQL